MPFYLHSHGVCVSGGGHLMNSTMARVDKPVSRTQSEPQYEGTDLQRQHFCWLLGLLPTSGLKQPLSIWSSTHYASA